jgi:hypothetical protein
MLKAFGMRVSPLVLALGGLLSVATPVRAQDHTCVVLLSMTDGAEVGNLDLTVDYDGLDGDVEGSGSNPVCRRALSGSAFVAFNDNDLTRKLLVSVIRLTNFSAPVPLVGCRVFYDTNVPVAGDFVVTVTNASSGGSDEQILPKPKVKVTSIECPGELPSATSTTTTTSTTTSLPVTSSTVPVGGRCGFPVTDGENPAAADALATLRAAVGLRECALCVCDIDDSGKVTASDALAVLRAAVGGEVGLNCPPCDM